jgi:hypothetical protein
LTAFLATAPPWRPWFLSELSGRLANKTRLTQVYAALNEAPNPPTKEELRPYLNRLVNDEDFTLAYQAWHATLPPEQRADESYPFNRDFKFPIDNLPFNWNVGEIGGANIQVVSLANSGNRRALLVEFVGRRIGGPKIVKQLMMLPAGDYSLSGKVKAAELRTVRGLWWRIFCANASANTLANTELVSGTMPWTDFAVKFKVPATDCGALWLQLELPARIEPELRIEGQVWYQDLRVTPAPTPSAAAPPH